MVFDAETLDSTGGAPKVIRSCSAGVDAVITDVTFGNASVTVAAVPEPNLLGACFVALPLWTMRRRRSI